MTVLFGETELKSEYRSTAAKSQARRGSAAQLLTGRAECGHSLRVRSLSSTKEEADLWFRYKIQERCGGSVLRGNLIAAHALLEPTLIDIVIHLNFVHKA